MLVLVDLFEFKVIVTPELGVASSHRVGSFQQVVAEIAVAGFNHSGVLRFKFTGLVLCPDKAGKLGDRGLGIERWISPISAIIPRSKPYQCQGWKLECLG